MITIKTVNENEAELKISKNTNYTTILLGIEMLAEAIINITGMNIDQVLIDIKRIYERDNKDEIIKSRKEKNARKD